MQKRIKQDCQDDYIQTNENEQDNHGDHYEYDNEDHNYQDDYCHDYDFNNLGRDHDHDHDEDCDHIGHSMTKMSISMTMTTAK